MQGWAGKQRTGGPAGLWPVREGRPALRLAPGAQGRAKPLGQSIRQAGARAMSRECAPSAPRAPPWRREPPAGLEQESTVPRAPGSSGSCERLGNLIRKASWHLISCTSALNGASLPNSPCLREARAAVTGEQGNEIRRVPARPKVRPGPGGRPRRGGVSAGGGRDGLRCYPSPPSPPRDTEPPAAIAPPVKHATDMVPAQTYAGKASSPPEPRLSCLGD